NVPAVIALAFRAMAVLPAAVSLPSASTVKVATVLAEPYEPAPTPELASSEAPTALAAISLAPTELAARSPALIQLAQVKSVAETVPEKVALVPLLLLAKVRAILLLAFA